MHALHRQLRSFTGSSASWMARQAWQRLPAKEYTHMLCSCPATQRLHHSHWTGLPREHAYTLRSCPLLTESLLNKARAAPASAPPTCLAPAQRLHFN